jgi:hypothetical protein
MDQGSAWCRPGSPNPFPTKPCRHVRRLRLPSDARRSFDPLPGMSFRPRLLCSGSPAERWRRDRQATAQPPRDANILTLTACQVGQRRGRAGRPQARPGSAEPGLKRSASAAYFRRTFGVLSAYFRRTLGERSSEKAVPPQGLLFLRRSACPGRGPRGAEVGYGGRYLWVWAVRRGVGEVSPERGLGWG